MNRKFESRITFHINDATEVERISNLSGWKFSKIDGDALLGSKPYCYLTSYNEDGNELLKAARSVSIVLLNMGIHTLRIKVEEIVYDTKTGHDVLTH